MKLKSILMAAAIMMLTTCGLIAQNSKTLVMYFSWGGTTEKMAKMISSSNGGELFRIEPTKSYPTSYTPCTEVVKEELDNGIFRQVKKAPDFSKYDTIFVGVPVWWHTAPTLMLLHQPFGDAYGAWRALEEFYEKGILKAIGISNFYADRMVEFASFNRIKPMVNQVECHPLNQQIEAKKWNDKYGIQLEAWAPFGEGRGGLFENPVLKEIAAAHGKTTAQVMLRWHLQRGIVVIPKSTHKERMAENLNVFDLTLTAEEMAKITALDTATSSFFSHQDPAMVEWFVKMVEERKKQQDSSKEKKVW